MQPTTPTVPKSVEPERIEKDRGRTHLLVQLINLLPDRTILIFSLTFLAQNFRAQNFPHPDISLSPSFLRLRPCWNTFIPTSVFDDDHSPAPTP